MAPGTAKQISKDRTGTACWSKEFGATASRTPSRERHDDGAPRLDLGVTLFEPAEIYGYGRSERILRPAPWARI